MKFSLIKAVGITSLLAVGLALGAGENLDDALPIRGFCIAAPAGKTDHPGKWQ